MSDVPILNISIIIIHIGFFKGFLYSYLNTEASMKRNVISCKRRKRVTKSMSEGSDERVQLHCTVTINSEGDRARPRVYNNIIIITNYYYLVCVCLTWVKKCFKHLIIFNIITL